MVRINRVYTKKGDGGETSLVGGRAVSKDDPRVQCYGSVDELNSLIGIVRGFNAQKPAGRERDGFDRGLQAIQQRLFDLGAELATHPGDEYEGQVKISAKDVTWLERAIDRLNADLAPLENFVLRGGSPGAAQLHLACTVCRRAERRLIALRRQEAVGDHTIPYLNRLSDALFVMARYENQQRGTPDVLWDSRA